MDYLLATGAELRAAGYDVPDGIWLIVVDWEAMRYEPAATYS